MSDEDEVNEFLAMFPSKGTVAAERFLYEYIQGNAIIGGGMLIGVIDEFSHKVTGMEHAPDTNYPVEVKSLLKYLKSVQDHEADKFKPTRIAVAVSRRVDNYLTYLSELVGIVLAKRPEALRSSKTVTLQEVLKSNTMLEFIQEQIESEVTLLTQKGYGEIGNFFRGLGLRMTESELDTKQITRAIEDRNLFVHRRGVIDRRYLDRLVREGFDISELSIGDKLVESQYQSTDISRALLKSVKWLDHVASEKYGLASVPLGIDAVIQAIVDLRTKKLDLDTIIKERN